MKWRSLLVLFLLPVTLCRGNDSAYKALRALGTQRGEAILNHVIEVEGRDGTPKPAVWKVLLDDQTARGGVRQLEISNGQVISEHTPVRQYSGVGANVVMDFQRLNLDSPGAFTIANQEALRLGVAFERVDYLLRVNDQGDSPSGFSASWMPMAASCKPCASPRTKGSFFTARPLPRRQPPPLLRASRPTHPSRRRRRRRTKPSCLHLWMIPTTRESAIKSTRAFTTSARTSNNSSPATAPSNATSRTTATKRLRLAPASLNRLRRWSAGATASCRRPFNPMRPPPFALDSRPV